MQALVFSNTNSKVLAAPAAEVAAGAAVAAIALLAALHALSWEFDPSWRMVSEYANGRYGWVLSAMFGAWALSCWALSMALWPQVKTRAGKVGVGLLIASGIGEAMAAVFDINHPLHDLAGGIGVLPMAVAASIISASLGRTHAGPAAKGLLLWVSNLIWISLVLLAATMVVMVVTLHRAGGHMGAHLQQLPPGVIAADGWANRLYVVSSCLWLFAAARHALNRRAA